MTRACLDGSGHAPEVLEYRAASRSFLALVNAFGDRPRSALSHGLLQASVAIALTAWSRAVLSGRQASLLDASKGGRCASNAVVEQTDLRTGDPLAAR